MARGSASATARAAAGWPRGTRPGDRVLLGILTSVWAISWPVVKIGIAVVPPVWFACFRYWIAALCLFLFVGVWHKVTFPPRSDWPLVAVSGVLQMAVYSALTGLALTFLPPGRASVLAFSTPIWVVPLSAWRLREPVSQRAMWGIGLGILGVLTIAAPSLHADRAQQIVSYVMLLAAAAAWAISIVAVRAHRFRATALELAPWQMLVAGCLLLPVAMFLEGRPRPVAMRGVVSLAYVGPVATAFAYWAVVEVGRRTPANTMSMALLATPCLGILISAVTLGERVGPALIAGVAAVGAGIRLVTSPSYRKGKQIRTSVD